MKYLSMPLGMWILFSKSFNKQLKNGGATNEC